jgi:6,7-dimethyl-8-ribityllumazine synthase
MRVALVVSSYHAFVTDRLAEGARAALVARGVAADDIEVFAVPGAFELPLAAERIARTGGWQGIVCLGCLIRGETPHFEFIAQACAHGVVHAAQATGVPIAFGVLTTNTAEEAMARAGDGAANKGHESAEAVFAMMELYGRLGDPPSTSGGGRLGGPPGDSRGGTR